MAIGFDSSCSINGSDEMLEYESLPLSRVCLIRDEGPRFRHITCEEEFSHDRVRLIKNQRMGYHHASIEVHRAHLISTVITSLKIAML